MMQSYGFDSPEDFSGRDFSLGVNMGSDPKTFSDESMN